MKKKVLFLIHDLGQGGAEKVLVNLVNHLDRSLFDISVISMFGGGINERFLKPDIRYRAVFRRTIPGNSKLMKLFSPVLLHRFFVKGQYDIEISYLEGPSARVISGCGDPDTRLISWIHGEQDNRKNASRSFRTEQEAERCYQSFDCHVFVSKTVQTNFLRLFPQEAPCHILYNTVESEVILREAAEAAEEILDDGCVKLISVGSLKPVKGFDRLLGVVKRLKTEGYPVHLYLLGKGPQKDLLERFVKENHLSESVTFLGYQTNPYKYVSKCDLYVCSSHREGFSTAVTEALIVGTPVCTVEVSGMKELLGAHNEYGLIVENTESAFYSGVKTLLDQPELLKYYKKQAVLRGQAFRTKETVEAVEKLLLEV